MAVLNLLKNDDYWEEFSLRNNLQLSDDVTELLTTMTCDEIIHFMLYRVKKRQLQMIDDLRNESDEEDEGEASDSESRSNEAVMLSLGNSNSEEPLELGDVGPVNVDAQSTSFPMATASTKQIDFSVLEPSSNTETLISDHKPMFFRKKQSLVDIIDEVPMASQLSDVADDVVVEESTTSIESPVDTLVFSLSKEMKLQPSLFFEVEQSTDTLLCSRHPRPTILLDSGFEAALFAPPAIGFVDVVANESYNSARVNDGEVAHKVFGNKPQGNNFLLVEAGIAETVLAAWTLRATGFRGGTGRRRNDG